MTMPAAAYDDEHEATKAPRGLEPGDELVLPFHRSVIRQYGRTDDGAPELRLFYGAREIAFDEPELFAFGEALAARPRFAAGEATGWGGPHAWGRIRGLLEQLLEEGVLLRASDDDIALSVEAADRPSPLPPAPCAAPRDWTDSEALMAELTGRPLEVGHLELVVPIFRVAHIAMDADGRQVGEANVFPKPLRLEAPTRWRACVYAGSRHQTERPMNVTALKAMRVHWGAMMAVLARIRAAYLKRFPEARSGWTVGHVERLATAVLALPTYLLMRAEDPVDNGALHPALSNLFRVTDGLRMTMHQMLFVPIGEPAWSADAPVTSAEIHAYAERNYSFHSEHGVCAGPRMMVDEFLAVIIDGAAPKAGWPERLEPEVEAALAEIEPALDYGLMGLMAYATVFSLWPAMTRAYEALHAAVQPWAETGDRWAVDLVQRLGGHVQQIQGGSYLGEERLRIQREQVYDDMFAQCVLGLDGARPTQPLRRRLSPAPLESDVLANLRVGLAAGLPSAPATTVEVLASVLADFVGRTQAVLRLAEAVQARLNAHLGRPAPIGSFDSRDVDLHNRLLGADDRRLPYLLDEAAVLFGLDIVVDGQTVSIGPAA